MAGIAADRAKRRQIRRGPIRRAVEAWLPAGLEGADGVRAEVARRLAAELDDAGTPPHTIARISSVLVTVVDAIEHDAKPAGELDIKRLLAEAITGS